MEAVSRRGPQFPHPYNGHIDASNPGELASILVRRRRHRSPWRSLGCLVWGEAAAHWVSGGIPRPPRRRASVPAPCSCAFLCAPPGRAQLGPRQGREAHAPQHLRLRLITRQLGSIVSSEDRTWWGKGWRLLLFPFVPREEERQPPRSHLGCAPRSWGGWGRSRGAPSRGVLTGTGSARVEGEPAGKGAVPAGLVRLNPRRGPGWRLGAPVQSPRRDRPGGRLPHGLWSPWPQSLLLGQLVQPLDALSCLRSTGPVTGGRKK